VQLGSSLSHYKGSASQAKIAHSKTNQVEQRTGVSFPELARDTMRLSLYVISKAGFNVRCSWPGRESEDDAEGSMSATEIKGNHKMSYTDSLEILLHNLIAVIILPSWLLRKYAAILRLRRLTLL